MEAVCTSEMLVSVCAVKTQHITLNTKYVPLLSALRIIRKNEKVLYHMQWLRRLVAGLSPQRPGFDPGSVHVGFMVDKVALGHVFLRVLRFSPVNFIPPVNCKNGKEIVFIKGLHSKPQGWGASVASAAGPFTKKRQ